MQAIPHPGVRFLPPFVFAAAFLSGLAMHRWVLQLYLASAPVSRRPFVLVGWAAILVGLSTAMSGLAIFWRARTSIIPNRPARTLVSTGAYRYSRNPMYVGLTTLYTGVSFLTNLAWPLLFLPLALVALQWLVIRKEERYLSGAFGAEYAAYCRRVRRWL